ncbi:MAG: efflux RND transporter periplasmic adaptor subunit [Planctomycetes bacterium]|nr:efflux RND transporter periplasmic adaptor subunit [Planctomycetota bacterium]
MAIVGALVVAMGGLWLGKQQVTAKASEAPKVPSSDGSPATGTPRSVEVTAPKRQDMSRRLDVPATMEAYEQADLYAKTSGYITEVRVDIGDRVKAGDVLAVIDVPEMLKEMAEAESLHAAAVAGVQTAESKIVQTKRMHDVAGSMLVRAQAEYTLKKTTLERRKELFGGTAITQEQLDEAQNQHDIAQADVGIADAKIAAAEADVASAEAFLVAARANVAVAQARIEKTQTLMQYARIVAPFDGIVTRRLVDRGALVQSATTSRTTPLFTMQRIDKLRIFIEVPESDIAFVRPGCAAKVKPYGIEGVELIGTIARAASSLKPDTRTMRTEIDLDNSDGRLMHGMYAQVVVELDERAGALTVPASSLLTEGKETFVYTVVDNRAARTPVRIGLDDGIRVQITEGLSDASVVVVTGKGLISDGSLLRPVRMDGGA